MALTTPIELTTLSEPVLQKFHELELADNTVIAFMKNDVNIMFMNTDVKLKQRCGATSKY